MAITRFAGPWTKLSNFSACPIWYEGHIYPSVEHAYQAQKTLDPVLQQSIRNTSTANIAKKMGRMVALRPDWEDVKIPLMRILLAEKFSQEPERSLLLSTGDHFLVEGNWWGDRFWGQCPVGTGSNHLGRMLMGIRDMLATDQDLHLSSIVYEPKPDSHD